MKALLQRKAARILPGLDSRLLNELEKSGASLNGTLQSRAGEVPEGNTVTLFRYAIEHLEAQVARNDGHPPMRKEEVDLMCRCLLSCATLEHAIRCAASFCHMLHPRAGELRLAVREREALFEMDSLRRTRSTAASLVDLTGLFCYLQLFSWLIGQPLRPRRVWLAHARRHDVLPLLGLFDAPVAVGEKAYGFAFDATLLAHPVVRRPLELDAFLADFPFQLIDAAPTVVSWSQKVRALLDAAIAREHALPSLPELAAWFGISEPTLRRRLASEGVSYLALRERCLHEAAERCLRDTDWTVARVASHLGFGGEEAFRRAFLRWTGHAPSHYRRQVRARA
jgi:AraC-like DNA-binding protein